jgi:HD superfamily phosphohydrolase
VLSVPSFFAQVVSSQLDADRFDYLLRDSYAAGVDYGEFDHLWLIAHLHVDEEHSRLYLGSKALLAAEAYMFARYHMYRTVHFHKTTRAAEGMLRLLFQRYSSLVSGKSFAEANAIVPNAPKEVVRLPILRFMLRAATANRRKLVSFPIRFFSSEKNMPFLASTSRWK